MLKRTLALPSAIVLCIGLAAWRTADLAPSVDNSRAASQVGGHYDYAGLIHLHTAYSGDATGSYEEIARDANAENIEFLVATDHNNLKAVKDHKEGWYGTTLFLTGVESTRPEGYLLGLNIDHYDLTRRDPTERFLTETTKQGGLILIAHPRHPKWVWRGAIDDRMAGMEIFNLADLFRTSSTVTKCVALLQYPFSKTTSYLDLYRRPAEALQMWDGITEHRPFVGFYAPDFHQSVDIGGTVRLRVPPASEVMRFARDHIVTQAAFSGRVEADKPIVYDAIRNGHLYVSLDSLGNAAGFMFSARRDGHESWMGDTLRGSGESQFVVTLPNGASALDPIVHLYRNGAEIARGAPVAGKFAIPETSPGAYRVEVTTKVPTFWFGHRAVTWIYSNPIYVTPEVAPDPTPRT